MTKKSLLICFAILFLLAIHPNPTYAQGVTATATWTQPGADVPTATAYGYTLKIDAAAPITLTASCSLVNAATVCSAPVANYVVGVHNVVLTASNANGSASLTTTTGAPPANPTGLKVVVVIIG